MVALPTGGMLWWPGPMDNREAADDLRDACMAVALQLRGWEAGGYAA